jgi:hypothetical protein
LPRRRTEAASARDSFSKTDRRNAANPVPAASSDTPTHPACRPLVRGLPSGWPLFWSGRPVSATVCPGTCPGLCSCFFVAFACDPLGCAAVPAVPRSGLAVPRGWPRLLRSPRTLIRRSGGATQTGPLAPRLFPRPFSARAALTQGGLSRGGYVAPRNSLGGPSTGGLSSRMASQTSHARWRLAPRRYIHPLRGDGRFATSGDHTESRKQMRLARVWRPRRADVTIHLMTRDPTRPER